MAVPPLSPLASPLASPLPKTPQRPERGTQVGPSPAKPSPAPAADGYQMPRSLSRLEEQAYLEDLARQADVARLLGEPLIEAVAAEHAAAELTGNPMPSIAEAPATVARRRPRDEGSIADSLASAPKRGRRRVITLGQASEAARARHSALLRQLLAGTPASPTGWE